CSASMPGDDTKMISAFSPPRSLFCSAPVVSTVKLSMWPLFFSNSLPSSRKGSCIAPPTSSFNCAASACDMASANMAVAAKSDFMILSLSFRCRVHAQRFQLGRRFFSRHEGNERTCGIGIGTLLGDARRVQRRILDRVGKRSDDAHALIADE